MIRKRYAALGIALGVGVSGCGNGPHEAPVTKAFDSLVQAYPSVSAELGSMSIRKSFAIDGSTFILATTTQEKTIPADAAILKRSAALLGKIVPSEVRFNIPITDERIGSSQTVAATAEQRRATKHYLVYETSPTETPNLSHIAGDNISRAYSLLDQDASNQPTLSVIVADSTSRKPLPGSTTPALLNASITELAQSSLKVIPVNSANQAVEPLLQEEVANSLSRLISFSLTDQPYTQYIASLEQSPLEIGLQNGLIVPYIQFSESSYQAMQNGDFTPDMLGQQHYASDK